MNLFFHQIINCAVNQTMSAEGVQIVKCAGDYDHVIVSATLRSSCMTCMEMTLIFNFDGFSAQAFHESLMNLVFY